MPAGVASSISELVTMPTDMPVRRFTRLVMFSTLGCCSVLLVFEQ